MKVQLFDNSAQCIKEKIRLSLGDRVLFTRASSFKDSAFLSRLLKPKESQTGCPSILVVLPDETVSSRHATIDYVCQSCTVEDLGSTNGTLFNGKTCEPNRRYSLKNGDTVGISGHEFTIDLIRPFSSEDDCDRQGPELIDLDSKLAAWIDMEREVDRQTWLRSKSYVCGTCRQKVSAEETVCRTCLNHSGEILSVTSVPALGDFDLRLGNLGFRWDRLLQEAVIVSTGRPVFVECRAVHSRDLREWILESDACHSLHLQHPAFLRLLAWFDLPAPRWKYEKAHVRVYEHADAVNLAQVSRNGPIASSIAAKILLNAIDASLYALEARCPQYVENLDIGQIWLVPVSQFAFCVKLDCHRQRLVAWKGAEFADFIYRPVYPIAQTISYARGFREKQWNERGTVMNAALILYRLVAGRIPEYPGSEMDLSLWVNWYVEELPRDLDIPESIAELIFSCLGRDWAGMPVDLREFSQRLSRSQTA